MKSVRRFIKKHKGAIIGLILIALLVAGLLAVKNFFFPSESKMIYGNRLEGRDKVKISDDTKNKVKEGLSEGTSSVKVRIAGRIIYIDIQANDDMSLEAAKDKGNKSLEFFSDAEKAYYDIQVLIDNKANQDQFPIIGYKHHTKTAIVWNRDRAGN